MKKQFLLVFALLLSANLFSQAQATVLTGYEIIINDFFRRLGGGQNAEALAVLRLDEQNAMLSEGVSRLDDRQKVHGSLIAKEKLKETKVGTSFIEILYVAKYEKSAFLYTFRAYKPKDSWLIVSFNGRNINQMPSPLVIPN